MQGVKPQCSLITSPPSDASPVLDNTNTPSTLGMTRGSTFSRWTIKIPLLSVLLCLHTFPIFQTMEIQYGYRWTIVMNAVPDRQGRGCGRGGRRVYRTRWAGKRRLSSPPQSGTRPRPRALFPSTGLRGGQRCGHTPGLPGQACSMKSNWKPRSCHGAVTGPFRPLGLPETVPVWSGRPPWAPGGVRGKPGGLWAGPDHPRYRPDQVARVPAMCGCDAVPGPGLCVSGSRSRVSRAGIRPMPTHRSPSTRRRGGRCPRRVGKGRASSDHRGGTWRDR